MNFFKGKKNTQKIYRFVVKDIMHYDTVGEYESFEGAMERIRELATVPWNIEPNISPCMSWETCSRLYVIDVYDASDEWKYIHTTESIIDISSKGVVWLNADVKVDLFLQK